MCFATWATTPNISARIVRRSTATTRRLRRMRRGRRNAHWPARKSERTGELPTSRTVIVAGAGIAGLTAALALARNGFRVVVLEQAERLEETGAGIQLSPNATRTLIELGLGDRLRPLAVAPQGLCVLNIKSGREIVRMPLGDTAE